MSLPLLLMYITSIGLPRMSVERDSRLLLPPPPEHEVFFHANQVRLIHEFRDLSGRCGFPTILHRADHMSRMRPLARA